MEAKYCMYCGNKLDDSDILEGCCNNCSDKIKHGEEDEGEFDDYFGDTSDEHECEICMITHASKQEAEQCCDEE